MRVKLEVKFYRDNRLYSTNNNKKYKKNANPKYQMMIYESLSFHIEQLSYNWSIITN